MASHGKGKVGGRLTGIDAGALRTAIAYDGFGRKVKVSHSDGTTGQINYDSLNRVVNMQWKERGRDSVFQALSYDLAGNITKMAREFGSYQIQYDETDQLVKSEFQGMQGVPDYDREFQYDLVGNAISGSRGHGEFYSNFLTQNGSSKFEADGDGLGQVAKEISANQVKSYGYRADGKISSFLEGNLSVNYFYDALDRLAAKMINQNRTTFSNTFVNLGDETRVLLGKAGDETVTKYVQGQGVNEHLGEVKGNEVKAYITDDLGSVLNSEVAGRWKTYGLFGEVTAKTPISPTMIPVEFAWQGLRYDSVNGEYDNEARRYNQNAGVFLSQDPIGVEGGVNVYGSRKNNPLTFSDPDGLKYRICSRPLHGSPGQYGPLRHDYIQFDDGTTYSFGPAPGEAFLWGSVISTNLLEDGSTASCSSFSNDSGRDEEIRKRAESNLLKKYNIYNFNCQDFVQDALR